MPNNANASTKSKAGLIVGALFLAGVFGLGVLVRESTTTDELPPDPFESNEPRVVDCVAKWDARGGVTANFYCEVGVGTVNEDGGLDIGEGEISDYYDEDNVRGTPPGTFTWSTTANTGMYAYMDVEVFSSTTGLCEVWVDGDNLLDSEEFIHDEESNTWFCRVIVQIT